MGEAEHEHRARRFWRGSRRLVRHPGWFWREHRRLVLAAGAAALVLLVGGGILAYELLKRPPDVHNPHATFTPQKPPKPPTRRTVNWPIFGLNPARTRFLPADRVKPPYRLIWHYTGRPLLEFPPVYAAGRLYFIDNNGNAYALDANTARSSGTAGSGASTPPRPPTTAAASTSSTWCPATSSSSTRGTAACSGNSRCRAAPSPRRWSSAAASTSAAKTATSTRSAPATGTCAGRRRSAARSRRRPPTGTASSTSATTAAT